CSPNRARDVPCSRSSRLELESPRTLGRSRPGDPRPTTEGAMGVNTLVIRGVLPAVLTLSLVSIASAGTSPNDAVRSQVSETYGKVPLHFEANRGQTDPQVKFLSRSSRHVLFLAPTEAVLVVTRPTQAAKDESARTVLRMTLTGANPTPRVMGLDAPAGKAHYFLGKEPAKSRTNVPTYAKVRYDDLYPGIDLIYYGTHRELEYDFIVRPGADPNR